MSRFTFGVCLLALGVWCAPLAAQPVNDTCATAINALDGVTPFDNTTATQSGVNPGCGSTFTDPFDLWYVYDASCAGDVTISLCGSLFDTRLAVWTGTCGALTLVACNDDFCGLQSEITVTGVALGDNLIIQVGGYSAATGTGTMTISCAAGPTGPLNDDCANAEAVGEGDIAFDTTGAITDGLALDPLVCDPGPFGDDQIYEDIWYCYTPCASGDVTVTTCNQASFDTRLAVYDGCTCPDDPLLVVACNDDGVGCAGFTSELTFAATGGNSYLIRVGGFSPGQSGPGTLSIINTATPSNDDCIDALPVTDGTTLFDTSCATTDGPGITLPAACGAWAGSDPTLYNDIWYCYTATCDGDVTVDLGASVPLDTRLAIFDGCVCPPDPASAIACDDDSGPVFTSVATFLATAGNSYLIQVGGWSASQAGPGQMDISCAATPTGPPDVSINEIRIDNPGSDINEYFELIGAPGTSLNGVTYVVIGDSTAGASGSIDMALNLGGSAIGTSGYFVAAESSFTLGVADLVASINFENSDNVTHLLAFNFTGAPGDDLDTDDNGIIDASILSECSAPGTPISSTLPPTVDTITSAAGLTITDLDVSVDISHTWIGDLTITLDSPAATQITLHDGQGGSADNILAIYDDEGIPNGAPYDAGANMQPSGPGLLSDFDGQLTDGAWTLSVTDGVGGDDGTLNEWCLIHATGLPDPPWESVIDLIALIEEENPPTGTEYHYGPPTVGPDGPFVPGHVLRCPDSTGPFTIGIFDPAVGVDTPGAVNLCIPPNDNCADAIVVTDGATPYTNVDASDDGPPACAPIGSDVWFSYTAAADAPTIFSLCDGTAYDAAMAIYDSAAGCPPLDGTDIACDDDGCGIGGGPSIFVIDAVAGTTYLIQVGGWQGSQGDGVLTIEQVTDCHSPLNAGYSIAFQAPNTSTPNAPISNTLPPVVDTITVAASATIADVNVALDISHTFLGDLDIDLTHDVTATSMFLYNQGDSSDLDGVYVLDDEALESLFDAAAAIIGGTVPPGSYQPSELLSIFDGLDTQSGWTMSITDTFGGDDGILRAWELIFNDTPNVVSIPDNDPAGVSVDLPVDAANTDLIADLDVQIDVTHTWIGDLQIDLTSPAATLVTLHDNSGGSSDDIHARYDDDPGLGGFNDGEPGTTIPDGPGLLGDFDLESVAGTWNLFIEDSAGGDTGTLDNFELLVCPLPCLPPTASVAADVTTGNAPLAVSFTSTATGTDPLTYAWDFGDGGISADPNPMYTYMAAGTYDATLTVTNDCGSASASVTITVCNAPVADFTAAPLAGPAPLSVDFTDLSSGDVGSYLWDFGDGNTDATAGSVNHVYAANPDPAIPYGATLAVTGACAGSSSAGPVSVVAYMMGDCNGDGGYDLADPIFLANWLFLAGTTPPCLKTCDVNGDSGLDLGDVVYALYNVTGVPGNTPPVQPPLGSDCSL